MAMFNSSRGRSTVPAQDNAANTSVPEAVRFAMADVQIGLSNAAMAEAQGRGEDGSGIGSIAATYRNFALKMEGASYPAGLLGVPTDREIHETFAKAYRSERTAEADEAVRRASAGLRSLAPEVGTILRGAGVLITAAVIGQVVEARNGIAADTPDAGPSTSWDPTFSARLKRRMETMREREVASKPSLDDDLIARCVFHAALAVTAKLTADRSEREPDRYDEAAIAEVEVLMERAVAILPPRSEQDRSVVQGVMDGIEQARGLDIGSSQHMPYLKM